MESSIESEWVWMSQNCYIVQWPAGAWTHDLLCLSCAGIILLVHNHLMIACTFIAHMNFLNVPSNPFWWAWSDSQIIFTICDMNVSLSSCTIWHNHLCIVGGALRHIWYGTCAFNIHSIYLSTYNNDILRYSTGYVVIDSRVLQCQTSWWIMPTSCFVAAAEFLMAPLL